MHGRSRLPGLYCFLFASALGCLGQPPSRPDGPANPVASAFDRAAAGTIQGQVTWSGKLPNAPPFTAWTDLVFDGSGARKHVEDNPNAPVIDPRTRGVAGAVVFLRGLVPERGRPWDHPPVRVVQRDYRIHVMQGDAPMHVGFVHRGSSLEMVSEESVFHALHASGAAYFSLAFPDPRRPSRRVLDRRGLVELSSNAGYFWMRAYLFVDDHPYYVPTDAEGRFALPQVPAGRYEVVCWLPNWREASHERDPETSLLSRLAFRPPVERVQSLQLAPAQSAAISFTLSLEEF